MSVPPSLIIKILQFVIRTSKTAVKGKSIVRKIDQKKISNYIVKIIRRETLGVNGGISQTVKIFKGSKVEEVWHVVVKAGRIIHKHLK